MNNGLAGRVMPRHGDFRDFATGTVDLEFAKRSDEIHGRAVRGR
jgi:hypothetical protein